MKNRKQLIEDGKHYFDNPDVHVMYATHDGNFFHENGMNYASSHAKRLGGNFVVETITREDYGSDSVALKDMEIEELQNICREADYAEEAWSDLNQKKLVKYIEDQADEAAAEAVKAKEDEAAAGNGMKLEDVSEEDATAYKQATGKPAVHKGKVTNKFIAWKENN